MKKKEITVFELLAYNINHVISRANLGRKDLAPVEKLREKLAFYYENLSDEEKLYLNNLDKCLSTLDDSFLISLVVVAYRNYHDREHEKGKKLVKRIAKIIEHYKKKKFISAHLEAIDQEVPFYRSLEHLLAFPSINRYREKKTFTLGNKEFKPPHDSEAHPPSRKLFEDNSYEPPSDTVNSDKEQETLRITPQYFNWSKFFLIISLSILLSLSYFFIFRQPFILLNFLGVLVILFFLILVLLRLLKV